MLHSPASTPDFIVGNFSRRPALHSMPAFLEYIYFINSNIWSTLKDINTVINTSRILSILIVSWPTLSTILSQKVLVKLCWGWESLFLEQVFFYKLQQTVSLLVFLSLFSSMNFITQTFVKHFGVGQYFIAVFNKRYFCFLPLFTFIIICRMRKKKKKVKILVFWVPHW